MAIRIRVPPYPQVAKMDTIIIFYLSYLKYKKITPC